MNGADPHEVARRLLIMADRFERLTAGTASYGLLRVAAGILAALPVSERAGCPVCGQTVAQPANGRPRVYCSAACRRAAEKPRRKSTVGT